LGDLQSPCNLHIIAGRGIELAAVYLRIESVASEKLIVPPLLRDVAVLHNKDEVGVPDRGEAVCDHKARPAAHEGVHRILDHHFGASVDRARRLVEDEHGGIGENGAGYRDELLLPLGDISGFLVDDRLVALGLGADEVVGMGHPRRLHHLRVARVGPAVADVLHDTPAEEPGILEDHAEVPSDIGPRYCGNISVVDSYSARVGLVEAHEEFNDGRFARAGGADNGYLGSFLRYRGKSFDHWNSWHIAEGEVLETDPALETVDISARHRFCWFLGLIQEAEDALCGRRSLLQNARHARELGQRLGEGVYILNEGLNVAYRYRPGESQGPAHHYNSHVASVGDEAHDRDHETGDELGGACRLVEPRIELFEGRDALFFPALGFDDEMGAEHLLDMAIDRAEAVLLLREAILGALHEQRHGAQGEGEHHESHKREKPAYGEHDGEYPRHGHNGGDKLHEALPQRLSEDVHVVCDP